MKRLRLVSIIVLAAIFALSLAACGGSSNDGFTGREARDISEFDTYVTQAIDLAQQREDAVGEDVEEGDLYDSVASQFTAANDAYKEGDYEGAVEQYESILDTYPLHLGANVNLTLALLQVDRTDDALVQSLCCVRLFPEEAGALLNAQVAGVACGFSAEEIDEAFANVYPDSSVHDTSVLIGSRALQGYIYNSLWDRIEVDLYGGGDIAEEHYAELDDQLGQLEKDNPTDEDVRALREYLDAVGEQLGYKQSGDA